MRILFVENHNQFVSVVTREFLSNHDVTVVPGIAAALQQLESGEFDVVLVDYDLDDGKGDQLVRKIRTNMLAVKIVAVSSHEQGNTALLESGADAICSKIDFNRIEEVLESLAT
jgi:DNA-binding response OmpR family regulator